MMTETTKVRDLSAITLAFADTNLNPLEARAFARQCDARFVPGYPPDHGMSRGPVGRADSHTLGKRGSDAHEAILFEHLIDGDPFRTLLWNVWVGQRPVDVRRELNHIRRDTGPLDVIVLLEAYRLRPMLVAWTAQRGYWHMQGDTGTEGAGVALLVKRRPGRKLINRKPMLHAEHWIGPKHGNRHAPRESQKARLILPSGRRVRLLAWHGVTGGPDGPNAAAVRQQHAQIARWMKRS